MFGKKKSFKKIMYEHNNKIVCFIQFLQQFVAKKKSDRLFSKSCRLQEYNAFVFKKVVKGQFF